MKKILCMMLSVILCFPCFVAVAADETADWTGYCNWWASIPAPIRTFLTHYDLSGKTIIPFCSMGGGRFGQTISAVAKLAPDSTIKEGLTVTYASYDRGEIAQWLLKNNITTTS